MYQIKIFDGPNDAQGLVIHSPYINNLKVSNAVVNQVLNAVHDFSFTINLKNPAWGRVKPLTTLIEVLDVRTNRRVFKGRVLQPNGKMNDSGHFSRKFTCESILGYLNDSSQRHVEIRNTTIREFFEIMINAHNRQVEPHKRFIVGRVTVVNNTDNVYRYLAYESTFESIKDKLVDRLGGYLMVREEIDGNYIDYLSDVGRDVENKPIQIAYNLQAMSFDLDPTQVITRLIPLGERIESEDEDAVDASQARLTIESVNNGLDYIDDIEMQREFGIIEKPVIWDDVTTPTRLLTNGRQFFRDQKAATVSYTVNSLNTELTDKDLVSFEIGNRHPLINPTLAAEERIQIIEKKIDLLEPQKSDLKIGDKHRTLTQYQNQLKRSQRNVVNLERTVNAQRRTISLIKNEVQSVNHSMGSLREIINDADIPNLNGAVADLTDAVMSLDEALDSIPVYETATTTQEGLMSAADKTKLDLISILNSIDLDQLYNDVENLKNNNLE